MDKDVPLAGFKYYTSTGAPLRYFEWASRTVTNLLYAIFNRQLATKLKPDPKIVGGLFKFFAQRVIDQWVEKMKHVGADW